MLDLSRRWGAGLYIVTEDEGATVGIREVGNVKKCRPVVKEPSGGTLLFRCALPARGASENTSDQAISIHFASALPARGASLQVGEFVFELDLCLGAACTGCIVLAKAKLGHTEQLCLGAACTGCIHIPPRRLRGQKALPRRCLHGVHLTAYGSATVEAYLCLGAACTGCISPG